jgi:hypothetical protein
MAPGRCAVRTLRWAEFRVHFRHGRVRTAHRMRYTRVLIHSFKDVPLPSIRFTPVVITALLLLQACATAPVPEETAAVAQPGPQEIPELTLNLPEQQDCVCVVTEQADYTFLEKGFSALVVGDHVEAVQHFQRYQRLESSPQAAWEADIAIAYDSMMPNSPFYDPAAARKSYTRLKSEQVEGAQVHEKVLLMRDSLDIFVAMERQLSTLKGENVVLKEALEKREEALKRLRELALGQKAAKP